MKRASDSVLEVSAAPIKRQASSMFSIAEVRLKDFLDVKAAKKTADQESTEDIGTASTALDSTLPTSAASDISSTDAEEEHGLFFDEDESDSAAEPGKSYLPGLKVQGETVVAAEQKHVEEATVDLRTGIIFECGSRHFDRKSPLHKERPLRITSTMEALENSEEDLYDRCCVLDSDSTEAQSFLDDEDYLRVHLPGYMQRLNQISGCNCHATLDREAEQFNSIYLTDESVDEAKKAASSLCTLVADVVEGRLDNGFAVIRPPGHHAEPGLAGGYCLINNVAVAAAYARDKLNVDKILIVDWDIHIGNGTQSMFLDDPNVLYFSVHRWHGGNFYPFLPNTGPNTVGVGEGQGYNVNVGWTRKGMGDEEYFAVWERVLMPIAQAFEPDLVLVSAGFDGAQGDLGECHLTPEGYAHLTRSLMRLAGGRVVCALEGGYVRSILGQCVKSVVRALLDGNSPLVSEKEEKDAADERAGDDVLDYIDPTAAKNIRATIEAHRSFWPCLEAA